MVARQRRTFAVFTTRPDTLFGATYLVLAPEHPLVAAITTAERQHAVQAYVTRRRARVELERTELARRRPASSPARIAVNPVNGQALPIWIADYVLMAYGTGAIMAVPATTSATSSSPGSSTCRSSRWSAPRGSRYRKRRMPATAC